MILYTLGFTKRTANNFFELLKEQKVELLLDIRLNNSSQLAGFTKGNDLKYFLAEICQCKYLHRVDFAPTKDILDSYKKRNMQWDEYEKQYLQLIERRGVAKNFYDKFSEYERICILCSEPTADNCHRRLLAEIIEKTFPQVKIKHL